jgi:hypothetical protein
MIPRACLPCWGALGFVLWVGCGDGDAHAIAPDADAAVDAGVLRGPAPPLAPRYDAGVAQPFEASDPVADRPAVNVFADAAVDSDDDAGARRPTDCLELESGETLTLEGSLDALRVWRRIDADDGCPATTLSAAEVAYRGYRLCPSSRARTLEITMAGDPDAASPLRDPLLVVYGEPDAVQRQPFSCLAASDDGEIDGMRGNGARVGSLALAADARAFVVASSHDEPDQGGVGDYVLTLRAD